MRQSGIVVPSGETRRARRSTRPSRLVVLPAFSPHTDAGRNTSAFSAASAVNAPTATTNRTLSSAARTSARSGKSAITSAPSSTSVSTVPSAAAARAPAVSSPAPRAPAPRGGEVVARGVEGDPTGEESRRQPEIERAVHVAAAQRGEELRVGQPGQRRGRLHDRVGGLRHRLATEDHDDVALAAVERRGGALDLTVARRGAVARDRARELPRDGAGVTGRVPEHRRGVASETRRARRDLDHGNTEVDGGAAHAEVQHRQLVFEIGTEEHDGARGRGRRWSRAAGRAPLPRAARRRAGRRRCRYRAHPWRGAPTRRRLRWYRARRRSPRSSSRPCVECLALQAGRRGVERLGPRHLDQLARLAHHRRAHAVGRVHPLVAVAALVAQPTLVDRLGVDAEQAHDAGSTCSGARRGSRPRTSGTTSRRSRDPRAGAEPVRSR